MQPKEPSHWGLNLEAIGELGVDLADHCLDFAPYFRSKTRDVSQYAQDYVSGLLRMDNERTIANIGRMTDNDEQAMHHFISNSPWSSREVIDEVQRQVAARAEVQAGAILVLDESGDEKAGQYSVGAAHQHNGRQGKVDLAQVGVFLSLAKDRFWSWVDGEVFLPERWFSEAYADRRHRAGVPDARTFKSKPELGWALIQRARANGLPFEAVACDSLYGRSAWLRDQLDQADIEYYADVPADLQVYLSEPQVGRPENRRGRPGGERVLAPKSLRVDRLRDDPETRWLYLELRPSERGILAADFASRPIWTVREDLSVHAETLLMRRDSQGKCTYTLTNASLETPLLTLARRKSQRYFIERSNQDAKSEFGWDEFQATKLRAWEHQLALTIMASWFIAKTKLNWAIRHAADPALLDYYQVEVLPSLSVANVRLLLCAALPLPALSPAEAAQLVAQHLDNRTRSRKSRLKSRSRHLGP